MKKGVGQPRKKEGRAQEDEEPRLKEDLRTSDGARNWTV